MSISLDTLHHETDVIIATIIIYILKYTHLPTKLWHEKLNKPNHSYISKK